MWNKIYLACLLAAIILSGVLLYLPYSWLQSITAPRDVAAQYGFYSNISWMTILISSLVLLLLGNVVLWTTRKSWAMWTTLVYFAFFIIAYTFWLENAFFNYRQTNNLEAGVISWSPLVGIVLIVLTAIIVFFNQYLVKRMQHKMNGASEIDAAIPDGEVIEETKAIDEPKSNV